MNFIKNIPVHFAYFKELCSMKKVLVACIAAALAALIVVGVVAVNLPMPENTAFLEYARERGFEIKGQKVRLHDIWIESCYFTDDPSVYADILDDTKHVHEWQMYNEKYLSKDIIEYYKVIGNDAINSSVTLKMAVELTRKINKKVISSDINDIHCFIYLNEQISMDEAEKLVKEYGFFPTYENIYEGDKVSIIELFVKDGKTLKKLQDDERVCFVDTTREAFHFGYTQKDLTDRYAQSPDMPKTYRPCLGIDYLRFNGSVKEIV